jgi:hypothetical protein
MPMAGLRGLRAEECFRLYARVQVAKSGTFAWTKSVGLSLLAMQSPNGGAIADKQRTVMVINAQECLAGDLRPLTNWSWIKSSAALCTTLPAISNVQLILSLSLYIQYAIFVPCFIVCARRWTGLTLEAFSQKHCAELILLLQLQYSLFLELLNESSQHAYKFSNVWYFLLSFDSGSTRSTNIPNASKNKDCPMSSCCNIGIRRDLIVPVSWLGCPYMFLPNKF